MASPSAIVVPAVVLVATVIRSAFGFGEALVAVPLLALVVPVEVAAPVAVLVSITVALIAVVHDWRKIHVRSAAWLILPTLVGTPLGLWMLKAVAEPLVKGLLAAVIIGFATWSLRRGDARELKDDRWAWAFGFGAGVLGGAYGMNGPPLAIYGALRRWSPQHFRATLQAYFLPASVAGMIGYWATGLWTPAVSRFYLVSLPLVIAATFAGRAINHRLDGRRFLRWVYLGLIATGTVLLYQAAAAGRT